MVRVRVVVLALAAALAATPPARAENVLRWASATPGATFDPHAFNNIPTITQSMQVYEPLVDFDSDHRIRPALAASWRLLDPLTWEFTLRESVRFHDGAPLTAADVAFSLRRALSPGSDLAQGVAPVAAVEADGDRVVRVTSRSPNPALPDQLFPIGIMSARWAERHDATEVAPYADAEVAHVERHANGTGPFALEEFEPGVRTVLVRNPAWWGLAEAPHNVDRVVYTTIADPARRVEALLAGEIDFLQDPPLAELERIAGAPGVRLERTMELRTIFLGLDQGSPELRSSDIKGHNLFKDRRVRQAVYRAIDIEAIRTGVMHGYSMPAGIIIQPGINGYLPELDVRPPHDPGAARRLLAEAGYPDGFGIRLDCPQDRYLNDAAICRAVAGMLGRVGIRVELALAPMREHAPKVRQRRTDFYMFGWGSQTFDPHNHLVYLYRSDGPYSATGYADPEVDKLIEKIGTELATYVRDGLIEEVWRRLIEEVVYVPLHHQVLVWALRDGLELPIDDLDRPRFRLARFRDQTSGLRP